MILEKYYNKDIVNTFTSITLFITSIVSANLLIRLFQKAYSHGLGINAITKFVILTLPQNVNIIVPIAMFLAIILCFGKYFSNNEMLATLAGGITWAQITINTLKPVLLLALATFATSMYLIPLANQTTDIFQSSLSARVLLTSITDGKVIVIPNGRALYVNNKSGNKLDGVFLYQKYAKENSYKVITSPQAFTGSNKNSTFLNFTNANIYSQDLKTSEATYSTADKATYTIYDHSMHDYQRSRLDRTYLGKLIKDSLNNKKDSIAELFSRINHSISVIVSGLLSISLCFLKPRQNKYAKLLPSVVILGIYLYILALTNQYMVNGVIPTWIGIWSPHILFIMFAIKNIRKQNGSFKRKK